MVVGLVTRTASQAGRTASRQIARRKASSQVYNPPEKYNLPDVDDTFLNPHKFWPFAWDKQAPFTLKYALFCCTGFSWPYFVVYYHMVLKE